MRSMRSRRAVPAATPAHAGTQLSFLVEPTAPSSARTRARARREQHPDRRPLPPAESLKYCNALLAEIDRVARLEEERVQRLAALYEAAVAHHPLRRDEDDHGALQFHAGRGIQRGA